MLDEYIIAQSSTDICSIGYSHHYNYVTAKDMSSYRVKFLKTLTHSKESHLLQLAIRHLLWSPTHVDNMQYKLTTECSFPSPPPAKQRELGNKANDCSCQLEIANNFPESFEGNELT